MEMYKKSQGSSSVSCFDEHIMGRMAKEHNGKCESQPFVTVSQGRSEVE